MDEVSEKYIKKVAVEIDKLKLKKLRKEILSMPTREEPLGGQRTKYIQQDEVVGLIDSLLAL